MADQPKGSETKSLEMRVAELEDKLAKIHITEEELKAYQKVSALIGGGAGAAAGAGGVGGVGAAPQAPIGTVLNCIQQCIVRYCTIIRYCTIVRQCIIQECINECGGGLPGGGGVGGGGFGNLGG
jgi:hypothetical protein